MRLSYVVVSSRVMSSVAETTEAEGRKIKYSVVSATLNMTRTLSKKEYSDFDKLNIKYPSEYNPRLQLDLLS